MGVDWENDSERGTHTTIVNVSMQRWRAMLLFDNSSPTTCLRDLACCWIRAQQDSWFHYWTEAAQVDDAPPRGLHFCRDFIACLRSSHRHRQQLHSSNNTLCGIRSRPLQLEQPKEIWSWGVPFAIALLLWYARDRVTSYYCVTRWLYMRHCTL